MWPHRNQEIGMTVKDTGHVLEHELTVWLSRTLQPLALGFMLLVF